jgi:hypothetical protein
MTDNQIFTALGISVVAGFLVIVFGFIAKLLWEYYVVNCYLKITARHLPDIEGDWEAGYEVSEGQWQAKGETKIKHRESSLNNWLHGMLRFASMSQIVMCEK